MNELPANERPAQSAPKDPSLAFVIEFVGGVFGFMGLGYFYAGKVEQGVVRLIGWWFALAIGWTITGMLTAIVIGCALIPAMLAAMVLIPYWSADQLKKEMLGLPTTSPTVPSV